ncbi:zinc finger protein 664-like isoform X5 [Adelges cooleyi]|uniref:zinc finger protein 664-like isoform X5 n=1 Tax=Adelges cooleyi TaxID=133065 RepID=UPI0021808405|nr:zinc finger protein 664-like isoform X5 [Adelges cooleyi]
MIKVKEEYEQSKELTTKVDEEKTKSNFIPENEKSNNGVAPQTLNDVNTYNVINKYNGTAVKVEKDILNGYCFESVVEIEENRFLDIKLMKYELDKVRNFVCDICKEAFTTKRKVAGHIRETHSVNRTLQKSCGKNVVGNTLSNRIAPKIDSKNSAKKLGLFHCNLCQKSYITKKQITLHIIQAHQTLTIKPLSRKPYSKHYNKNSKALNKSDSQNYKCNMCLKPFSDKSQIRRHMRVHTGEKPYKCEFCEKAYSQKPMLQIHKRVHTGEKPFKCTVCLKSFTNTNDLKIHNRVHTGEKPYKCSICLKSFAQVSYLTIHKRVHTGEKPFKCDVCMKSFSVKSSLTIHKRTHSGEKPYNCDVCLKSFVSKSRLTDHQRVHTGQKYYKCDMCLKLFSLKYQIVNHMRVHTGEKPYKCAVCLKSFSSKAALTKHIRTHTDTNA